ncbi:MAG: hypothetical protein IRZ28_22295 [Steroidobacteraceae bacterium]|nr:hypothetical protein [Steroidobacteraceae bacterium]
MPSLASSGDLADRLGRDLTAEEEARADTLLADASALVRSYTGRSFEHVVDDEQVLRVVGGRIKLPRTPVTAVTRVQAVSGRDGVPDITIVDWAWDKRDTIRIGDDGTCVINLPEEWRDDDGFPDTYRVTYSHGYETVPADVVAVVCGMVLRTLTAPTMAGGVVSESIGSYSYRLEAPGTGLSVMLSPEDRRVLDRYRRTAYTVKVTR